MQTFRHHYSSSRHCENEKPGSMKLLTICQTGLKLAQRGKKRYEEITKRKTTASIYLLKGNKASKRQKGHRGNNRISQSGRDPQRLSNPALDSTQVNPKFNPCF